MLGQLRRGERSSREDAVSCRRDGTTINVAISAAPVTDGAGRVVAIAAIVHDMTERKALERDLRDMAFSDPLTGLANRASYVDRLEQALQRAGRDGRVGVLFLDLDDFKSVNDRLGHQQGDALLCEVVHRLSRSVRRENLVARLGGDEFTVLVEDASDLSDLEAVAARIREALHPPIRLEGAELSVRASIGIALSRPGQDGVSALLHEADLAMYAEKLRAKGMDADRVGWITTATDAGSPRAA